MIAIICENKFAFPRYNDKWVPYISIHIGQVEVRVNMGKDFSRDRIEVTGTTDRGAYIAFSGIDYDLYSKGGNVFLTEEMVSHVTSVRIVGLLR